MNTAHRILLYPTLVQAIHFARAAGCARFAYNWALAQWNAFRTVGEACNALALRKKLNAIKRAEFPWMMEVTKWATDEAIRNLGTAFGRFFKKTSKYPKYKKKGKSRDTFAAAGSEDFSCCGMYITLPFVGRVRMAEEMRFPGAKLLRATVSRTADRWYVSVSVVTADATKPVDPLGGGENQAALGVDLGIKAMATCSDGTTFANPMPLRKHLKRLKRLQRKCSRKRHKRKLRKVVCGEEMCNIRKAAMKVARLHARISNIRKDALHKATTTIVRTAVAAGKQIALEDLNVRGMMKNERLALAISDVGLYEFRRQTTYKAERAGVHVCFVNRFYASSKTCSGCGAKKESLALSERTFRCEACGMSKCRDRNAADNIAAYPSRSTAGQAGFQACGDRKGVAAACEQRRSRSEKQEVGLAASTPPSEQPVISRVT